jgi:acyl-CoA reductase-like NAD-dependent aldehyde dehydrogenase
VPHKHVTLELGGNAAALVCADWAADADLDRAASRIATFANYQAGQSCIAVQRVIAHTDVYDRLAERIVARVAELRQGDPSDEATDVGPMISQDAADRVRDWVRQATDAGATALTDWSAAGPPTLVAPVVLADVPPGAKVWAEEVFGPVLALARVDSDEPECSRTDCRPPSRRTGRCGSAA